MKPLKTIQHYDLETLAKSLKLESIDVIRTSKTEIESHWFRSVGPADLYFWKSKNKLVKHQISFYSQIVEWNEYEGVKTGFVNDDEGSEQGEIICFDKEVNVDVLNQALEFLNLTKSIEEGVLVDLISHYKFYNRWQNLHPVQIIKRIFGSSK